MFISSRTFIAAIRLTLFCLTGLAFFVAGGVFAANVDPPDVIESVGGVCFFGWWVPAALAVSFRSMLDNLECTHSFSVVGVLGCVLVHLGAVLFFIAAVVLTPGPVSPDAKALGVLCLHAWWLFAILGVGGVLAAIVNGIRGKKASA